VGELEALEAVTGLRLLANDIEDRVDKLGACKRKNNTFEKSNSQNITE
jgi:hypothetical protein